MGRKLEGLLTSPFLCKGKIFAVLQLSGNIPFLKEKSINTCRKGATISRVVLRNNGEILS